MKYCQAVPGCRNKVQHGPCPQHRRSHARELRQRQDQWRGSSTARGYGKRWQARAAAFRRQYPLCGMRPNGQAPVMSRCHDEGRVTAGEQTDHVVPHKGDQELFWDEEGNWQTLCGPCGAAKSRAGL